jgi:hypothetical protein
MQWLHSLLLRCSRSLWAFVAIWLGSTLSIFVLLRIGVAFAAATEGLQPFDLQNDLTVDAALAQLPRYTAESHRLYALFAAVDFVFPLVASLASAATAAFLLRHGLPSVYARLEARRGLLVLLLPTLFDWLENVAALAFIYLGGTPSPPLATLLVVFKRLKLGSLNLLWALLMLLTLVAVVRKVAGWSRAVRRA